jgi:hypothetical protein
MYYNNIFTRFYGTVFLFHAKIFRKWLQNVSSVVPRRLDNTVIVDFGGGGAVTVCVVVTSAVIMLLLPTVLSASLQ